MKQLKNGFSQWMWVLAIGLLVAACGTKKTATTPTVDLSTLPDADYLKEVVNHTPDFEEFSAKMRLVAEYGHEKISVGGTIKMKKDEVIQLSLVAIGFVEAAKIEITPKRLILLDRIGRRYIDVPYNNLKFFSENNIDFYTLQSLFRNELFLPNVKHVGYSNLKEFQVNKEGEDATLTTRVNKRISYSFLTALANGLLKESNILTTSNYQLSWKYSDFLSFREREFPTHMTLSIKGAEKPLKASFTFSRWSSEANYEPISIPERYQEIKTGDILKHLLSL